MPKNPCHNMPKKMRWCLPIEPWAPNQNHELQIKTMSSKYEPWAPNVNRELKIETVSSNSQPWAPILNRELQMSTLSSKSKPGASPKCIKMATPNDTPEPQKATPELVEMIHQSQETIHQRYSKWYTRSTMKWHTGATPKFIKMSKLHRTVQNESR